jgi:hypothetical protein
MPIERPSVTNDNYKDYLGDSVYAAWDGHHIVLTTENGYGPSNTIALDPGVIRALEDYQKRLAVELQFLDKTNPQEQEQKKD